MKTYAAVLLVLATLICAGLSIQQAASAFQPLTEEHSHRANVHHNSYIPREPLVL